MESGTPMATTIFRSSLSSVTGTLASCPGTRQCIHEDLRPTRPDKRDEDKHERPKLQRRPLRPRTDRGLLRRRLRLRLLTLRQLTYQRRLPLLRRQYESPLTQNLLLTPTPPLPTLLLAYVPPRHTHPAHVHLNPHRTTTMNSTTFHHHLLYSQLEFT